MIVKAEHEDIDFLCITYFYRRVLIFSSCFKLALLKTHTEVGSSYHDVIEEVLNMLVQRRSK
jgi:hypothetical protein